MKAILFAALLLQASPFIISGNDEPKVDVKEDFKVEQLSESEIKKVQDSRAALDEAERLYNKALYEVKEAHGQTIFNSWGGAFAGCNTPVHTVTLRGHYALIETHISTSGCSVLAVAGGSR